MHRRKQLAVTGIVFALLFSNPSAQAAKLQAWVLSAGTYGVGADPAPTAPQTLELDALPQRQVQRMDAQYGASFHYRGIPLHEIIAQYAPPASANLVLLYFKNGMVVPLPFRDAETMNRLSPFVALQMASTAEGPFVPRFPPISKHIEDYADIPQVMFSGNKLVVSERWHPEVPKQAQESFTPWALADSLVALGFADSAAYYRQFEPSPQVHQGFESYRQSCQFCHGVRKVGASFGWDFGQPVELHPFRQDPNRLYFHIHHRPENRVSLEQMPVLKFISESQTVQLWRFLRTVSTTAPLPYSPAP